MTRAISRPTVSQACLDGLAEAEETYSAWTGGVTMRAAPESFVQTVIAKRLHAAGSLLILEASVKQLLAFAAGDEIVKDNAARTGRIDIVTYYKSKAPRFLIEIKKLGKSGSFREDHERIVSLMAKIPSLQNGFLVGYTVAAESDTVERRLQEPVTGLAVKIIRKPSLVTVKSQLNKERLLGAAIYRVDRPSGKANPSVEMSGFQASLENTRLCFAAPAIPAVKR